MQVTFLGETRALARQQADAGAFSTGTKHLEPS